MKLKQAKQFDRAALKMLRSEIEVALRPIAQKYAIALKVGDTSFAAPDELNFLPLLLRDQRSFSQKKKRSTGSRFSPQGEIR